VLNKDQANPKHVRMTKHILLIDDDPDEIDIFIGAFRDAGQDFKYDTVSSSVEALKFLRNTAPDYIILDYKMPKMNGLECLVEIKKMPALDGVPVVLYSSSLDEDIIETAQILGVAGCVVKPFDMRTLPSLLQPYFK
jgi:CheY-like chemotaxis protein